MFLCTKIIFTKINVDDNVLIYVYDVQQDLFCLGFMYKYFNNVN